MTINSDLSDSELLALLAKSNESAFSVLYKRYWKKVLAVAVYKISSIEEAESIVQDIFYSLWQRRESLEVSISFNNYLMASVKYRVIKVLDRQRRERLFQEKQSTFVDILDDSTQEYLECAELTRRLAYLVKQLPEIPRLIYKLNKDEGKSYKEIGIELNMTEKAVDAHLFRVKKNLREKLGIFLFSFLL